MKMYGFRIFCTSINYLTTCFSRKTLYWYCCNNAVSLLNKAKGQTFQSIAIIKNFKIHLVCQPANLPAVRPTNTRCTAPEIQRTMVIASGLRNCYSDEDSSAAPWRLKIIKK